jgi:putative peptidoglycan lipid II flippase
MMLGLGVLQLNTFFDAVIAGYPSVVGPEIFGVEYPLREGAISAVNFAQRLYQFPLGVFGIAIATAIFPALARAHGDERTFTDIVRRGLRLVVFVGVPAGIGLILVRRPLAAAILEGGNFSAASTERVGRVLIGYAAAVWAYSAIHVLTRAYYARGDTRTPVRVAVGMVALNLLLNCVLIWTPLREAGLAWSTAICATIQGVLLLTLLRGRIGAIVDRSVRRSWGCTLVASVVMTACVAVGAALVPSEGGTWWQDAGTLLVLVGAGAVVFAAAAATLRMRELSWIVGRTAGDGTDA